MSLPASYFEGLYARSEDPWGFSNRWYEQRKYQISVASLPRERYRRGFEPGCSIGVLTEMLAQRCDRLISMEVSSACLAVTRRRKLPDSVSLRQGSVPRDWPDDTFDLIVLSELGYYLSREDLDAVIERATSTLRDDGHLLAVHWRGEVPDYPLNAAEVHRALSGSSLLRPVGHYEDSFFLLDVFSTTPAGDIRGPEEPNQGITSE